MTKFRTHTAKQTCDKQLLFDFVCECTHPSHSEIDIIVDCFSVNHGLSAFLFNILIILLIYLF